MNKPVIASKYLPTRPIGVVPWLVVVLSLDYWAASPLVWGLVCGAFGLLTLGTWFTFVSESDMHPTELPKK